MTTTIQIKRRQTGNALVIGTAPLKAGAGGMLPGEFINDEIANILYIAIGNDGSGNSTNIIAIGGSGAFLKSSLLGQASGVASLGADGKLTASQIPSALVGGMQYQGTWNASTNTPALTSSTGTKGYFYKVSVAGATALDGQAGWNVGDFVMFDGATWDKIDGPAEAVLTVAGRIGAIILTSADLTDVGVVGQALFRAGTAAIAKAALGITVADVAGAAPLASPLFTGTPTAPTAPAGTNNTQIATTAFVAAAVAAAVPTAIDGGVI